MKPRQQGFTLIELAIVMLLLTILAAGVLVPLTKRIEIQRYEETQKILGEAKEALIGFAMSHKDASGRPYLPCPDKAIAFGIAASLSNDGIEDRTSNPDICETLEGNFPWATLGVGRMDAWGNQLRYRVTLEYAGSITGFSSSTTTFNSTQLLVCTPPTPCPTSTSGTSVPANVAVIVSHGPNGWGATNSNGTVQAAPTSADEMENTNGDTKFISRAPTPASATTTEFDDVVVWLPQALLVSRVCPSGGCP
jgi:prepilin-type N-terminal cleavage/methylation domain-containing protein